MALEFIISLIRIFILVNGKTIKFKAKGCIISLEGDYYELNFMNLKRNGGGIYQYNTGNRYEGEWKDQKSGFGLYMFSSNGNRESYEGSWLEDEKDCEGIYSFGMGINLWVVGKRVRKRAKAWFCLRIKEFFNVNGLRTMLMVMES